MPELKYMDITEKILGAYFEVHNNTRQSVQSKNQCKSVLQTEGIDAGVVSENCLNQGFAGLRDYMDFE